MANTPAWFDYETYMANKLAQLQADEPSANWTASSMMEAFTAANFVGEEGAYEHFVAYGADEEVAPNAYFNADEYYYYKTVDYFKDVLNGAEPTEFQIAQVQQLIESAGYNAWTHYVAYGSSEGIDPSANFDASAYCTDKAAIMNSNGVFNNGALWTAESMEEAINAAGYTVLGHYLEFAGQGNDEVKEGATYPVEGGTPIQGETFTLTTENETITGTEYNDTIIAGEDANGDSTLNARDSIDGLAGTDTLILNDGVALVGTISNVENLVIANEVANSYNFTNYSSLDSITLQNINANGTGITGNTPVAFSNLTNQSITIEDAIDNIVVNASYANSSAATVANLSNSGAGTVTYNLTSSALKTINLEANSDGLTTVNFVPSITQATISGSSDVKVTGANGLTSQATINAEDLTGDLDIALGSSARTTLVSGSGDDTISLGLHATVTGGTGEDTFNVTPNSSISISGDTTNCSTIQDFIVGEDTIKFTSVGAATATVTNANDKVSANTITDLAGAVTAALTANTASTAAIIWFQYDNNTYVVYDKAGASSGSNAFSVGDDMIVRINGTVDLTNAANDISAVAGS